MVFFDLLHSLLNVLSVGVIHMGTRDSSSLTFQSGVLFHYLGRNDGHWDCFQNFPDTNSSAGKIPIRVLQSIRHVTGGISGQREFAHSTSWWAISKLFSRVILPCLEFSQSVLLSLRGCLIHQLGLFSDPLTRWVGFACLQFLSLVLTLPGFQQEMGTLNFRWVEQRVK